MSLKLSPKTIDIIKNFSTINPSLLFRKGNILRTRNPGNNLYGVAQVAETFEQEFAVYDLSRFLTALSTFTDPELKFSEKSATIIEGDNKLKYTFCNIEDIVVAPDSDMKIPSPFVSVNLEKTKLERVLKAQAILSLPEFIIVGNDGKLTLETTTTETKVTDSFVTAIGKTDKNFKVVVKAELLTKLMTSNDYTLDISRNKSEGILSFRAVNNEISYFIAPEPNSVYPG